MELDIAGILRSIEPSITVPYKIRSLEKVHDDVVINCPFHSGGNERTGSFHILTKDKTKGRQVIDAGVGHCFACGTSVTLPQLVSYLTGKDDNGLSGYEYLKDTFGIDMTTTSGVALTIPPVKEESPIVPHTQYKGYHPYFTERGITNASIEFFELGYDPVFGGIVLPIKDKHGSVRMLVKRSVQGKRFHNTTGAKKSNLMFGLHEYYKNLGYYSDLQHIVIVESALDAIILWQLGHVAFATLQAIPSEEQLDLINQLPVPNIVIGTDNDQAGIEAVGDYTKGIKGKKLYRLLYNEGEKDVGDKNLEELKVLPVAEIATQTNRGSLLERMMRGDI